jgi:hypothetical protein
MSTSPSESSPSRTDGCRSAHPTKKSTKKVTQHEKFVILSNGQNNLRLAFGTFGTFGTFARKVRTTDDSCWCSSVVEQLICNQPVASSNLVTSFIRRKGSSDWAGLSKPNLA